MEESERAQMKSKTRLILASGVRCETCFFATPLSIG